MQYRKEWIFRGFGILGLIEGIFTFVSIFWIPSMNKNVVFGGYSLSRLLMGASVCIPLAILGWFLVKSLLDRGWYTRILNKIDNYLKQQEHLLIFISLAGCIAVLGIVLIILFNIPVIATMLGMITAIFHRGWSILLWLILLSIQMILGLIYSYHEKIRSVGFWKISVIFKTSLVPFLIILSIFHWLVLYLHVYLFQLIPYWYWKYWLKDFSVRDFYFIGFAIVALGITLLIIKNPSKKWFNFISLIVLGYGLQVGFGFIDGNGIEAIRYKFIKGGHSIYAQYASQQPDVWEALTQYDILYGTQSFTDTKPPGVLLFHIIVQKISNSINPVSGYDDVYLRTTSFMAYVFPFLSVLVLFMIYTFSKPYLDEKQRFYPLVLYVVLPNFLLMTLEIDQAFFPILFMGAMILWQKTINNRSVPWAVVSGLYVYFALYFTFSMLPVIPMSVLWIGLESFLYREKSGKTVWEVVKLLIGLFAGVILGYFILRIGLGYDFFLRYQNAFSQHHFHKNYATGIEYILNALVVNNVEFAAWTGFAFFTLFLIRIFRSFGSLFRKAKTRIDGLVLTFAGTYAALNVFGQTRSEVGRLWLFLLPLMVIFGAEEAERLFKKKWVGIVFIVICQLITVYLTFKYQDSINR